MTYVFTCARAAGRALLEQRGALAALSPSAAPLQARWLRTSRTVFDNAAKKGGGALGAAARDASDLVDPSKDARPMELFAIPLKKPLIPGVCSFVATRP
jgi:hypothetical protein